MRRALWAGLIVAVIVHILALYVPGSPTPGQFQVPGLDKVVHVVLFAVPAYLAGRLTPSWWPLWLLAAHAPISELVQWRLIPHRSGDWLDLVADLSGVAIGAWLATRAQSRHGRTA